MVVNQNVNDDIKLEPCPFCGKSVKMSDFTIDEPVTNAANGFKIWCPRCNYGFKKYTKYLAGLDKKANNRAKKQLAKKWNTRSTLGIVQTATSITCTATGSAAKGMRRGFGLGVDFIIERIKEQVRFEKIEFPKWLFDVLASAKTESVTIDIAKGENVGNCKHGQ